MQGVEFEKHGVEITDEFRRMYDEAVDLWAAIDVAFTGAREDGALDGREFKSVRTQQFGAGQLVKFPDECDSHMRARRAGLSSSTLLRLGWNLTKLAQEVSLNEGV